MLGVIVLEVDLDEESHEPFAPAWQAIREAGVPGIRPTAHIAIREDAERVLEIFGEGS